MARRFRVARGNAQFQPLGRAAARVATRVLAPDPGARGVARDRADRSFGLSDPPHAGRPGVLRAGARDAVAGARGAHAAARPRRRVRADDRVRGAAHAVAHVFSALAAADRGENGAGPYAAARAERARCGALACRGRLRSRDGLPPPEPSRRARSGPLRHADARHGADQPVLGARPRRPRALRAARHGRRARAVSVVHAQCVPRPDDGGDHRERARAALSRQGLRDRHGRGAEGDGARRARRRVLAAQRGRGRARERPPREARPRGEGRRGAVHADDGDPPVPRQARGAGRRAAAKLVRTLWDVVREELGATA